MERVASGITISEHERLLSLTRSPSAGKQWSVPVELVEEMRGMDPARRTVVFATSGACTAGELHVLLEVTQTRSRIIAGREVDIRTQRRSISIAVLVGKAHATASIVWILDSYA
jgi:hypothetical protein